MSRSLPPLPRRILAPASPTITSAMGRAQNVFYGDENVALSLAARLARAVGEVSPSRPEDDVE